MIVGSDSDSSMACAGYSKNGCTSISGGACAWAGGDCVALGAPSAGSVGGVAVAPKATPSVMPKGDVVDPTVTIFGMADWLFYSVAGLVLLILLVVLFMTMRKPKRARK
jgi:hypothetical protein